MCGIAGILGRLDGANREALRRMNGAIAHRGPDDEGYWSSAPDATGSGALFAFRRLAILDLSPAGAQPMIDPVSGHALVFNGEIYNYVELRRRLAAEGQTFRSSGDTEVMLRALGLHGRAALRWLRGMFALALWDPHERRLLLARDAFGIKPLYFARNPDPGGAWSLAFASELRALLASGLLGTPRLNPLATAAMAWNGFTVAPETAVAGVQTVWPGELRVFDAAGAPVSQETYWSAAPQRAAPASEEEIDALLREGVRLHLASDVPLAIFLSGGIDSSAVANLAQRASGAPVHTFTLAFEEAEHNEGPAARRIAAGLGSEHHEVLLTEERFIGQLDDALDSLDQPSVDGLNSYYMARAVREAGFKVALVGSGGDELFGGYPCFREVPALLRAAQAASRAPAAARAALAEVLATWTQRPREGVSRQNRWAKLPEVLRGRHDVVSLYQLAYALFLPGFYRQLLGAAARDALVDGLPRAMHERLESEILGRPAVAAISVLSARVFLGERLLRDTDAASMSASIEVRLPLVDPVLFAAVDRLPEAARYRPLGRKALLRRIGLRGLDPALFERPKRGFVLPFDRWLKTRLGKVMDEAMRDAALVAPTGLDAAAVARLWQAYRDGAPGLYWTRIWSIYALLRWCHRHRVYL